MTALDSQIKVDISVISHPLQLQLDQTLLSSFVDLCGPLIFDLQVAQGLATIDQSQGLVSFDDSLPADSRLTEANLVLYHDGYSFNSLTIPFSVLELNCAMAFDGIQAPQKVVSLNTAVTDPLSFAFDPAVPSDC